MNELSGRIGDALRNEEAAAERFAGNIRLVFLLILTIVAAMNSGSVSVRANILNFSALLFGYLYGFAVRFRLMRRGYRPVMKYITSYLDIMLIFLLLVMYTTIDIPSVALKNYVFLLVFPFLGLTSFRYDRMLTGTAGGLAVLLYIALVLWLAFSGSVRFVSGGYERELFSNDITYVGQITKLFILIGFVLLMSYHARYSHKLFEKLVGSELSMRQKQEMTEWELTLASGVQRQFLPKSFPRFGNLELYGEVRQGRFVGGDYYDFIKLAEDRLLVVIADVSGNGVPAALIMSEVRAAVHLLASVQCSLMEFARKLNALIYHSTDKKSFVTLFIAEIDSSGSSLKYVNAGHPAPRIYDGIRFRALSMRSTPLGMLPDLQNLQETAESFHAGSMLVGYTDGLFEQTGAGQAEYGEERLLEFVRRNSELSARPFVDGLLDDVRIFAGDEHLKDDAGCIVVKYLHQHIS